MGVTDLAEKHFQAQVVELANICGWGHMHVRRTIGKGRKWTTGTSRVGWPDLTLWHVKRQRLLMVELKTDTGNVTPEQTALLTELRGAGVDARVWRPTDWDEIQETLTGRPAVQ